MFLLQFEISNVKNKLPAIESGGSQKAYCAEFSSQRDCIDALSDLAYRLGFCCQLNLSPASCLLDLAAV